MRVLESALRRLCADLRAAEIKFALVGGLAVSVRTEPRFTRDADLTVAFRDDEQAEALVYDLQRNGYRLVATVEQEAVERLATARLQPPLDDGTGVLLDLLFASSGIESEIVEEAELLEVLPELSIPVARTGHLIALKILSRDDETRPQDIVDLRALTKKASREEIERARKALKLIESRGFHRGRPLLKMLGEFRKSRS
ncbi:MAG TPA: nucleotidyl transferase AbiEii/AbiGii toxin family protein [Vicinamibacteria bacterium]|nr:nucleotidyl transferase AbiEii/AbiGii toxin family protein [Vicinamibacteria bacterium]